MTRKAGLAGLAGLALLPTKRNRYGLGFEYPKMINLIDLRSTV